MYNIKTYKKAKSVQDAITLLKKSPEACLIAGGTEVLIGLHKNRPGYDHIVDIHDLKELRYIKKLANEDLEIGSGSTFTEIIESELITCHLPVLAEAASKVGGPQIRNVATIGGNLCNGVTCADSAPTLFSSNALLTLESEESKRQLPIEEFFLGAGKTACRQDEILTAITIRKADYNGYYGHCYKYAMRNAMDIATIVCSAVLKLDGDSVADLRICYGVAGPVPLRCKNAESKARGAKINDEFFAMLKKAVQEDVNPRSSWRASKEFRLQIICELAHRVVKEAIIKAGGKVN